MLNRGRRATGRSAPGGAHAMKVEHEYKLGAGALGRT